jgi:hypothetical protein
MGSERDKKLIGEHFQIDSVLFFSVWFFLSLFVFSWAMTESQNFKDSIPPRELTESQEENLLPEHRKTRPRIIVTKEELDEIQKKRKIKISDLIKIAPSSAPPSPGNLIHFIESLDSRSRN